MILAAMLLALAASCAPGPSLAYVCGAERPEDMLALPTTRFLVASGFARGSGLKLVDTDAKTAKLWFTGAPAEVDPDRAAFPACPGPVDPAEFNARGLSLRTTGPGSARLHVVNHGGRESIEVFDIKLGETPTLRWRGCLPMPPGQVGNAVATFADGTVLATVLTRPGTTITDFVQGRVTGGVWAWRPGGTGFALLEGTELPGNNGLETDPDDRHFYVIAFGWHALVVYDRSDTTRPVRRIVLPDFMPDNVHWSGGRLVAAGMRLDEPACGGVRQVVNGEADKMLCHRGYGVAAIDPVAGTVSSIAHGEPDAAFNGVSSAVIVGDMLWLGSYQADRIAYRVLP